MSTTEISDDTILIIGAGLSGLVAARDLMAAGRDVLVIDKGRSVGGRLATRRMAGGHLDHGAQFFTVRGDTFAETIAAARKAGVVDIWCEGFDETPDGYPRYNGRHGMNQLAKWLAKGVNVSVSTLATAIRFVDERWRIEIEGREAIVVSELIVTSPIPQTLALLDTGFLELPGPLLAELGQVDYFATLGLLAVLDGPTAVRAPGGLQFEDGPFTFVADNQQKGISPVPAITLHANHEYSARRIDDDPDEVLAELIELAQPWLGGANIVEAQLKTWRYAGPVEPFPEETVLIELNDARMALAGDAFGGPKVEGAFNSGRAAAKAILTGPTLND